MLRSHATQSTCRAEQEGASSTIRPIKHTPAECGDKVTHSTTDRHVCAQTFVPCYTQWCVKAATQTIQYITCMLAAAESEWHVNYIIMSGDVCCWTTGRGCITLWFSAWGAFRAKVNCKRRNASRAINKAKPSSPDVNGKVFEKSRAAPFQKRPK